MAGVLRRYSSTIYGKYRVAYLKYGCVSGIAVSIIMLLWHFISPDTFPQSPNNYAVEGVLMLAVIISGYLYRKSYEGVELTFKELMLLGLGTGVVASVVYGLFLWLFCGVICPDVVQLYINQRLSAMDPAETSAKAKVAVELTKAYTAGDWAFIGGFRLAVLSVLLAFVMALLLGGKRGTVVEKKKKNKSL